MKFKRLFPVVPEALAALGDAALAALLSDFRSVSAALKNKTIDLTDALIPEGTAEADIPSPEELTAEAMRQWREAAEFVGQITQLQADRAEGIAVFEQEADEIHAAFGDEAEAPSDEAEVVAEADAEVPAEQDEPTAEAAAEVETPPEAEVEAEVETPEPGEAEPVVVAAGHVESRSRAVPVYPAVARRNAVEAAPQFSDEDSEFAGLTLTAAGGLSSARVNAGDSLDLLGYAEAVVRTARSRGARGPIGSRERILVASTQFDAPEGVIELEEGDRAGNAQKIREMGGYFRGAKALRKLVAGIQAAGGICAPPEPVYTIPGFGTTARPVAAFLPTVRAPRGAISVPGVTTILDYADVEADGGITVIEAADDAEGGTFSTKSCADMTCAEWTDYAVGIIAHCREYGNLNAITWPEGVAHENDNTMVLLARTAEARLLQLMDALMLDATGVATYGASSTLLYNLTLARLGMISTLRLDPATTRVQVLLPFWAADMFAMDLMHGAVGGDDGRFDTPASAVTALLGRYGFDVGWHLDQASGGGATQEIWATQADGAVIRDWPGTAVIARLYLPNTFVRLDTGELELGVVRDSALNHENNFELFGELFEGLGRIGPASATRRLTLTVCPDGTIAAPDTSPFTCNAS